MAELTRFTSPGYYTFTDQSIMPMRLVDNLEKQSACDKQKRFVESREKKPHNFGHDGVSVRQYFSTFSQIYIKRHDNPLLLAGNWMSNDFTANWR